MKRKFMNFLDKLSREEMRTIMGGYGDGGYGGGGYGGGCSGVNKYSADCPCSSSSDWCVNGLCQTRPMP